MAFHFCFLAGKPHEQRTQVGYSPCGGKVDMTKQLITHTKYIGGIYSLKYLIWELICGKIPTNQFLKKCFGA